MEERTCCPSVFLQIPQRCVHCFQTHYKVLSREYKCLTFEARIKWYPAYLIKNNVGLVQFFYILSSYDMVLRHGKWQKLQPQSYKYSLIAAYEESWISTGRKWSQMKNSGEEPRKPRYLYRLRGAKWNWIGHNWGKDMILLKEKFWIGTHRDNGKEGGLNRRGDRSTTRH